MSKPKAIIMGTPEMENPFYTMFQNTTNSINKKLDKLLKLFDEECGEYEDAIEEWYETQEDRVMYKAIDYVKVKEIEMRYTTVRKISKEDMMFCNEMWRKYNK